MRAAAGAGSALALSGAERAILYTLCVRNSVRPDRRGLPLTRLGQPAETIRLVAGLLEAGYVYWDSHHAWDLRVTNAGAMAIGERLW